MRKRAWTVAIAPVLALVLAACGTAPAQPAKTETKPAQAPAPAQSAAAPAQSPAKPVNFDLKWGTITAGGAWQVIGSAMLEDIKKANPGMTGSALPSSTSANVLGVKEGKFSIGFSLTDTTATAWDGEDFFKSAGQVRNVRNLATLYPQATHIVVWADSNIKSIKDLKGKRVSPGAKGLSCDLEFQRLVKLYGMSYSDMRVEFLSFDDATQNFMNGQLDALAFTTVAFPYAPVLTATSRKPIRLLPIEPDKVQEMTKFRGVSPFTLPGGIYQGQEAAVDGIAVRAHIIVRDDMPDDVAYQITKTLADSFDRYGDVIALMKTTTKKEMASDAGIPFHPGALKYYKEQGWIK